MEAFRKHFPDNNRMQPFWLKGLMQQLNPNSGETARGREERKELKILGNSEKIPTSQAAFRSHPLYALESLLGRNEIIHNGKKNTLCEGEN